MITVKRWVSIFPDYLKDKSTSLIEYDRTLNLTGLRRIRSKNKMREDNFDRFYRNVSEDKKEGLRKFRSTHKYRKITINNADWKYISGGGGKEALLLLTGGTGISEAMAFLFAPLENEYRIICPFYAPVGSMEMLIDGIMEILESEGIYKASIIGQSFGGIVAQAIVRRYPDRVSKLILSHTTTTSPPVDEAIALKKKKSIEMFKVFYLLPSWFFRFLIGRLLSIKISKISKMSLMDEKEREFWHTYFLEMVSRMTKKELSSIDRCMIDFAENYKFTRDDLAGWPGKILILESDKDTALHSSEKEAVKKLYPQASVHNFKGSGHLSLVINPEKSISIIRGFLSGK
jgi:pimeloyl-ACP methyl ester carboxylesterase